MTAVTMERSPETVGTETRALTAVAMSGGLDSSVTAWLLAKQGDRRVVGLSMLLWNQENEVRRGRCCGALDVADAKRVARQSGIPHYTLRMDEEFRDKVVDPFVHDYLSGRTPIPCVGCNTWLKFDLLLDKARAFGADRIATGHYARIVEGPDGFELHRAVDPDKDQSYYLFELTQEQLAKASFPLGDLAKPQVRELAREAGLVVAEKPESMEICFVERGVRQFVEQQVTERPESFPGAKVESPARVVTEEGEDLGESTAPYYRYTVGQRRGLGVSAKSPLYVLQVRPEENELVVGDQEKLMSPGLTGERLHFIQPGEDDPGLFAETAEELRATVRIRSHHPGVGCTVRRLEEDRAEIRFDEPQRGVSPGQAAVLYDGTRVLGGCWIAAPEAR